MLADKNFLKKLILTDQIISLATDTVFGLIANAKSESAIEKLYNLKKRDPNKAFAIFVDSFAMLEENAETNQESKILLEKYPNLTLILKQKKDSPLAANLNKHLRTIAVRMPSTKLIKELIKELNFPLAATSVNISGEKMLNSKKEILEKFADKISFVEDINIIAKKPSTIIDLVNYKLIREGDVSKSAIEETIKCKIS